MKTKKTKNHIKIIKFITFIIIIAAIFMAAGFWLSHPALAGWWPDGGTAWLNRKQLTLTNNSGGNLNANAVVTVTIDTQSLYTLGKLKSDCSDLRIVYNPNSTTYKDLNRYVGFASGVTCSTSTSSKVSFALQAAVSSAASSTDYYVYYNNPDATAPTNNQTAFSVGASTATFVCPFDGSSTCLAAGTATPTTESGAIRYSGSKSALSFDGASDYVDAGDINAIDGAGAVTISAWVKFNSLGDFESVVDKMTSGNVGIFMASSGNGVGGNDDVFVGVRSGSNTDDGYTNSNIIAAGVWNYWTVVYNGGATGNSGRLRFFLNGIEQTLTYRGTIPTSITANAQSVRIGGNGSSLNYFNGTIDEVSISNSARYTSNFTTPTAPFVRDSNTIVLYHFDENGDDPRNTGKTIDDSGNGNHGTITGAKYVAGLVGVNASTTDTGNVPRQSYAGHEGVMIEEATTNKITNPSFENATYDTNWTAPVTINVGTGADGAISLTAAKNLNTTVIGSSRSTYADGIAYRVIAPADSATSVTRYSGTVTISNGIAANDEVLLINLQGASGDSADVGNYEFKTVSSVTTSTVTFTSAITKTFAGTTASNQKVIIQRIPQYTDVTLTSAGSITASAWEALATTPTGAAGYLTGIVAFRANGTVSIASGTSITANELGYQGGAQNAMGSYAYAGTGLIGTGTATESSNNEGGGGGLSHSNPGLRGTGAAGGGYATAGAAGGDCTANCPTDTTGAPATSTYGAAALTTLYFGSGGGGNTDTQGAAVVGGKGGGIIFLGATTISNSGTISANGQVGHNYTLRMGGAGGGAGGSIFISSVDPTLGTTLVTATGGTGGTGYSDGGGTSGAGGNGGVGRIRVEYTGSLSGTTSPAASSGSPTAPLTVTQNTTAPYYKFGSNSAKIVASGDGTFVTSINPGNTNTHMLSAYVYDGTAGNVGGTVGATVAKLVYRGTAQTTTYTDMGGGWWRLTYSAAAANAAENYGVQVLSGKTVYVDGVQLEDKSYSNNGFYTSYADGSLGTGYTWDGTANNSTSTRAWATLKYSTTSNLSQSAGTLSFWYRKDRSDNTFNDAIVGWGSGCTDTNALLFGNAGGDHLLLSVAGANLSTTGYTNVYGKWRHMVVTWNGSGRNIYVDGTSLASDASGAGIGTVYTTLDFQAQACGDVVRNHSLSDFRIYNAAISSTDVSDLYYAGLVGHSEGIVLDRFGGGDTKGQDPLAVWHMDEGYGTTVNDSSRNNKPLTASGATWESGIGNTRSSRARFLKFDGSTSYLSRAQDGSFDFGTGSFSVSGWFHHNSTAPASGTHTILARYGSAGFKVYMNTSGYVCFGIDADSTWSPADTACSGASDGSLADSKWHHLEAVKNGTTSISLYIDGHLSQTTSVTATGSMNTASSLYLGVDSTGNTNYWNGWLDEFMVYPYARSAAQVKTDLLDPVSVLLGSNIQDPLSNGLVGYWKMDESSGNAADSSGNSYTLTNNATATFAAGKFANAGSLASASSQYFNTATNMGNIQTTSFWVNPTSTTTYLVDLNGTQTITATSGTIAANSITGSTIYVNGAITSTITANVWQHVVVTSTTAYAASAFAVGKVGANYLNGTIDDVRIYNRALTPKEVRDLYAWAPGPQVYLNMDEGSGTSSNDISGNSRTGTLNNGPLWASGKYGKGIKLDGSNDNVSVGDFGY